MYSTTAITRTLATIDLLPTILELAGVPRPAGHLIDGVSFAPVLLKQQAMAPRKLFWKTRKGEKAVRDGKWKLLIANNQTSLFDLSTDPGEQTNLAASHPAIVNAMKKSLDLWIADVTTKAP